MRNPLRLAVQHLGEHEPLLLAHHPTCEYYDHHTVELYGYPVCMGCFVVYPVGFASLFTLLVTRVTLPRLPLFDLATVAFYGIGFSLATPMLADKLLPGRRRGRTRMVAKAALAVGLAFLAFPAVVRPSARLLTALLFVGFLVPYVGYKGLTVREDCQGCPEYDDFPNCSGMAFDDTYRYRTEGEEGTDRVTDRESRGPPEP